MRLTLGWRYIRSNRNRFSARSWLRISSENAATGAPRERTASAPSTPLACSRRRGLADQVAHHAVDHAADRLVDQAPVVDAGIAPADLREHGTDQRHIGEIGDREQPGAQPVVEVVVVVGDVVGERGDLRLGTREGVQVERMKPVVFGDRGRRLLDRGERSAQAARCA